MCFIQGGGSSSGGGGRGDGGGDDGDGGGFGINDWGSEGQELN